MESEKRELIEEVERLQQRASKGTRKEATYSRRVTDADSLSEELYALRTQRTETSAKLAHFDVEVSELKMAAESSKVRLALSQLTFQPTKVYLTDLTVQRDTRDASIAGCKARNLEPVQRGCGGGRAFWQIPCRKGASRSPSTVG